jgi:hypothetical protein
LIPEEFNEGHKGTPWMRSVDDETLQENLGDDFLEPFIIDLMEGVKDKAAEPVGVCVGVTEMQEHGAEEMVLSFQVKLIGNNSLVRRKLWN